jgi:hypothetical protein
MTPSRVTTALAAIGFDDASPPIEFPVDVGERWPVVRTGRRPPINRTLRRLITQRDRSRCALCMRHHRLLELDHIVPWSAGGSDRSDNLRSTCHSCNADRSNYRTVFDTVATPVTLACDACIRDWVMNFGVARYGRTVPDAPELAAWCGTCQADTFVTDPARLR